MRILDKDMMMIGMEQIGLDPSEMDKLDPITKKPNGIILVTGPTGCGKTTTLYAVLSRIYNDELKIITTEDPVEYQLDGVVQVNINASVGLTFASCLRAILRQDPDIIMVGEIRDLETAQISIQSALTGHLVLSTIHTNDAPSTVTRLIDMEIEPLLLASTLEAVVAQRLVRTICPTCKEVYTPEPELLEEFGRTQEEAADVTFYHGKGCDECNFTGYRGRIGIFEILIMNEELCDLVIDRVSTNILLSAAKKHGFTSMREDGWRKIVNGLTTIDEVMRQTHMDTVSDETDEFGEAELEEKKAVLEAQEETIEITDSEVKGVGPEDAAKA